jgi:CRISPR-associated protein Cas1
MKNLHELPKFGDKLSYLYVEHAVVDQEDKAIAFHQADGTTHVPAAGLAVLILGPGTSVTHAAVKTLADNNCQVIWSGEPGVRFYAHGLGGSRHSRNLIRQARLVSNDLTRLQVVVRMYCLRFDEAVDSNLTLQQLRGKEGIRVRQAYAEASKAFGVPWQGRSYKRSEWDFADPVNRALSAANACLYGLVHAALISGGYSPALGFIHTGKQLSFVYDIADLYKARYTIPLAFAVVKGSTEIEREVRIACRDCFRKARLMERILPDIQKVLDVPAAEQADAPDEFADDAARPADLWTPEGVPTEAPIGQILKMEAFVRLPGANEPQGRAEHGGADPGTGNARTAG